MTDTRGPRRGWGTWLLLFLFALALRAGVAAWRPPPLDGDQRVFLLFVHESTGRWALSGKDNWVYLLGVNQYRSGNEPMSLETMRALREEVPSLAAHVRSHPLEALLGYGYRWGLLLEGILRQWLVVLAPLGLLGIAHAWRRERQGLVVLCLPLFVLPVYPVVGVFFRHTLVTGPVLVAMSAIGIVGLLRARRTRAPELLSRPGPLSGNGTENACAPPSDPRGGTYSEDTGSPG